MSFTLSAQNQFADIGSLKYSILPPEKFREANGVGWVLLDGGEDMKKLGMKIKESDLCVEFGVCNELPDIRNMFIRSHDNRSSRKIATYQPDLYKKHLHEIEGREWVHPTAFKGNQDVNATNLDGGWGSNKKRIKTNSPGGGETRPKNFNFYTYIKVNTK